ncbi:thyroid receptor-interacting protein 6-like isoform X2 [Rhynchophorus ferrugineus]|uniref:thyroid receptor-interacting protein 6-like isoform X2 n=1 Tax=Rhynchophorus ferrugineus TaxID=354439 RepID=UPI003FCD4D2D
MSEIKYLKIISVRLKELFCYSYGACSKIFLLRMENLDDLLAELSSAIKSTDSPPRSPIKTSNSLGARSWNMSNSKTKIIDDRAEHSLPPVSITNADMVHVVDSDDLPLPPPPPEAYESNVKHKAQCSEDSNTKGRRVAGSKQNISTTSEDIDYNKEVDNIFDNLLPRAKGKSGIYDDNIYGICAKCGEEVKKGDEACIAIEKLYHSRCFTCFHCCVNLENVEFYNLNGEPYCKEDYIKILDKCTVCHETIETKILRASDKPYHPSCFCCVECGKNLVGKSFMSNDSNQIHCVDDFYEKYAPECWYCKRKIVPKPGDDEICRVVALDRSFHETCFKCEDCNAELFSTGKAYYPINDHIYCKECSAKRIARLSKTTTV